MVCKTGCYEKGEGKPGEALTETASARSRTYGAIATRKVSRMQCVIHDTSKTYISSSGGQLSFFSKRDEGIVYGRTISPCESQCTNSWNQWKWKRTLGTHVSPAPFAKNSTCAAFHSSGLYATILPCISSGFPLSKNICEREPSVRAHPRHGEVLMEQTG